jgi:hypothetical protein
VHPPLTNYRRILNGSPPYVIEVVTDRFKPSVGIDAGLQIFEAVLDSGKAFRVTDKQITVFSNHPLEFIDQTLLGRLIKIDECISQEYHIVGPVGRESVHQVKSNKVDPTPIGDKSVQSVYTGFFKKENR